MACCYEWILLAWRCDCESKSSVLIKIQGTLEGTFFVVDLFLELEDGVEQRLRPRRAARDVNIDGNDLIAALDDSVIVENAARRGASPHGDDPLGFWHLIIELTDDRGHFLRKAAGNDHKIGLARRGAKHFGTEARNVKARGSHGHHFDGAAGETETERPDRTLPRPVHGLVELREDDAFVFEELPEVVGLGQRDMFAQECAHGASAPVFSHSSGYILKWLDAMAQVVRGNSGR